MTFVTKGKFSQRILKNRLLLEMCGIQFPINHRLFDVFNRKFQQLFSSGIINRYIEGYFDFQKQKRFAHLYPEGPEVLTMKHLEAGFFVWLCSIFLAVFVFAVEWLNKFRFYLIVNSILHYFFEQKQIGQK